MKGLYRAYSVFDNDYEGMLRRVHPRHGSGVRSGKHQYERGIRNDAERRANRDRYLVDASAMSVGCP